MATPGAVSCSVTFVGSYVAQISVSSGANTDYINCFLNGVTVVAGTNNGVAENISRTVDFSGLSPGQSYTLAVRPYGILDEPGTAFNATIKTIPIDPNGSASAGEEQITVSATFGSGTSSVDVYIVPTNKTISSSGGSVVFTGLTGGKSYTPYIRALGNNGVYSTYISLGSYTPTSAPPPPTYPSNLTSATATSTQATITASATPGSNTTHINVALFKGGVYQNVFRKLESSNSWSGTFSGLLASTAYELHFVPYNSDLAYQGAYTNRPISTKAVTPFSWGVTVSSGSSAIIYASKWLELQTLINEIRIDKGKSAYGFTGVSYVYTNASIYAWLANQFISSMSDLGVSLPSNVSTDSALTASWFNSIASAYNNII